MNIEEIQNLSDDEKIKQLNIIDEPWKIGIIISTLSNDEIKIELLKKYQVPNEAFVIASLTDDNLKIQLLSRIKYDSDKARIVSSINDEEKRIELLDLLNDYAKSKVILSIKSDKRKIELLEKLENDGNKANVIKRLKDLNAKIILLKTVNDNAKVQIILSLGEEQRKDLIKEIQSDKLKAEVIKSLTSEEEQRLAMKDLKSEESKMLIILNFSADEKKIDELKELKNEWNKIKVISSLQNDKAKMKYINIIQDRLKRLQVILSLKDEQLRRQLLDKKENKYYKKILEELKQKNSDVISKIDVRILQEKYLKGLGKDKINLISCYPDVQEQILNLPDKQYQVFINCINNYLTENKTEDWTQLATYLLENMKQYAELIDSIENFESIDITKLSKIMQDRNVFSIRNVNDIENYEKIKHEKCDEIIQNSNDVLQIKEAVFQKLFGHSTQYAQSICDKYGEGIKDIEDCDEKYYVLSLMSIFRNNDIQALKNRYLNCNEVELTDKTLRERTIKNKFAKLLSKGLFEPNSQTRIDANKLKQKLQIDSQDSKYNQFDELKLYDAGTSFKMIVTSVDALGFSDDSINFQKSWNRAELGSQQFCASYIRNDCIKTVKVVNLCYGFINMCDDALVLAGTSDIGASTKSSFLVQSHGNEKYYSPDILVEKTDMYNEIDFRRIQNGKKKQPDYIVALKKNGRIDNLDKILKAAKDWDNRLPIVIVDVDECQKANGVPHKEIKQDLFKRCYDKTTELERLEMVSKIKQLYILLEDIGKENVGQDEFAK